MGVDPADPFAKDSAPFDPFHGLLVAGRRNLGKHLEVAKNLAPVFEIAKRQLTDDAGMGDNLLIVEQARQSGFLSRKWLIQTEESTRIILFGPFGSSGVYAVRQRRGCRHHPWRPVS